MVGLERQRQVVWDELVARRRAYPERVASGTMRPGDATRKIEEMEAVFASIDKLYALECVTYQLVKAGRADG